MEKIDWQTIFALVGIIITVLTFLGGVFVGISTLLQALDRNTQAIIEVRKSMEAQWKRLDEYGDKLDDHGEKIARLEAKVEGVPR